MQPDKRSIAVLFPGQGSQTDDMRQQVEREAPELLEAAVDAVGDDPFAHVDESTRFAQPAIYCASLACWSRSDWPEPDYLAGHSLGEIAALVAAECMDAEDGLGLVTLRGQLMERAAAQNGPGGMLAVLNGQLGRELAARFGLSMANDNAPDQVVVSGNLDALELAARQAQAAGVRAVRLPIRGAFHSPALAEARDRFAEALAGLEFRKPRIPVLSCVTARPIDEIPRRLAEGITSRVRWRETLLALRRLGVTRFVETGPGKVLTGLVRRTLDDVEAFPPDRLEAAHA
jgi:[acyl-carrier-protein] S-malonyltransferase